MKYLAYLCLILATASMVFVMWENRAPGRFALFDLIRNRFRLANVSLGTLLAAGLAGEAVVLLPFVIFALAGWTSVEITSSGILARSGPCLLTVAGLLFWAAVEELIFRGAVFYLLLRFVPAWTALAVSAVVFAGTHFEHGNSGPLTFLILLLDGLGFGIAYWATGSLWAPTIWHATKNICVWAIGSAFVWLPAGLLHVSYAAPEDCLRRFHALATLVVVSSFSLLVPKPSANTGILTKAKAIGEPLHQPINNL